MEYTETNFDGVGAIRRHKPTIGPDPAPRRRIASARRTIARCWALPVILLTAALTLTAAVGCVPRMPGVPLRPRDEPALAGTAWKLELYGVPGSLTPALSTADATIEFTNSELFGDATCNTYSAQYTSNPNGMLSITGLGSTEMSCTDPGVMIQEQSFLDALTLSETYEVVDGELRIFGGGTLLVLKMVGS